MTYYYRKGEKYSINNKMLSRAVNIVHCITKKSAMYITVIYHVRCLWLYCTLLFIINDKCIFIIPIDFLLISYQQSTCTMYVN